MLDKWLQSCADTHSLWCKCPEWRSHVPGWRGDTAGDGAAELPEDVQVAFDIAFEDGADSDQPER
ncbi:ORF2 [Pine marten torque teno virus 1]|nr:ORF2 [Pine marten torque teno virus 1]AEW87509.1 ORF2 [Pine marten torque teno virus 1]